MSDFHQLSPEVRAAFVRIDAQFMHTGRWPRSRAAARHVAEACNASGADVAVLAGFKDKHASAPAKRIARFLHGAVKS